MISIIVCSINPQLLSAFSENVKETIGVPYEIIAIDNVQNNEGICKVYNKGARAAKYEVLCFAHEDILFRTNKWGGLVLNSLQNPRIGLLGVAGSTVKTMVPSPWWISNYLSDRNFARYNVIHSKKGTGNKSIRETYNPDGVKQDEVVTLDGLWLCCKKEVWESIKFDDKALTGFHFYDLDFSLSVRQLGYQNIVSYEIDIEHSSKGTLNKSWLQESFRFYEKWKTVLPVYLSSFDKETVRIYEYEALKNLIIIANSNKYKFSFKIFRVWALGLKRSCFKKEYLILMGSYLKHSLIKSR